MNFTTTILRADPSSSPQRVSVPCLLRIALLSLSGIAALMLPTTQAAEAKWEKPVLDWEMPVMEYEFEHSIQVTAESHASGEYTLQDALDDVPEEGAVIELGEGVFEISGITSPEGRPLKIVGQGPDTMLKAQGHLSFSLAGTSYLELSDFAFDGQGRHWGIRMNGEAYENVIFRNLEFSNFNRSALNGGAAEGPITGLLVTNCKFTNVGLGANFRIGDGSRYMEISNNKFVDVRTRPITVGTGGGDVKYAKVINNHIENVGPGRHPIGILSYTHYTLIADNTIINLYNEDGTRQEAISSRGSNTIIRGNTMINAGGRTAAVSLAGQGPTLIEGNVIQFTEDHQSSARNGMDLRQSKVYVVGNVLTGTSGGITLRRGIKDAVIENNEIKESKHLRSAVHIHISTRATVPAHRISGATIRGNHISNISKEEGEGPFIGFRFGAMSHRGEHDVRLDDIVVSDNTFSNIHVADGAQGVDFSGLDRPTSHMKNFRMEGNDFGEITNILPASAWEQIEDFHAPEHDLR